MSVSRGICRVFSALLIALQTSPGANADCPVSSHAGAHGGFFIQYDGPDDASQFFYGMTRQATIPMQNWRQFYANAFQLTLLPGTVPKEYKKSRDGQLFILMAASPITELDFSYRIQAETEEAHCCRNTPKSIEGSIRNATAISGELPETAFKLIEQTMAELPGVVFCRLAEP